MRMAAGESAGATKSGSFTFAVLEVVASIPRGRAMTYGDVARFLGSGSPRSVGQVLARRGHEVPWQRVVMADGSPPSHQRHEQLRLLRAEGVPLKAGTVDLARARWRPKN